MSPVEDGSPVIHPSTPKSTPPTKLTDPAPNKTIDEQSIRKSTDLKSTPPNNTIEGDLTLKRMSAIRLILREGGMDSQMEERSMQKIRKLFS